MMNHVALMGRLTATPELKTTQSGISRCEARIAVERSFKRDGESKTDFINLVLWREKAEFFCRYFSKGQLVAVEGQLNSDSYEKDGQKRTVFYVTVADIHFTGDKKRDDAPPEQSKPNSYSSGDAEDFAPIDDTDLPF